MTMKLARRTCSTEPRKIAVLLRYKRSSQRTGLSERPCPFGASENRSGFSLAHNSSQKRPPKIGGGRGVHRRSIARGRSEQSHPQSSAISVEGVCSKALARRGVNRVAVCPRSPMRKKELSEKVKGGIIPETSVSKDSKEITERSPREKKGPDVEKKALKGR